MAKTEPRKRSLEFADFNAMLADVDALQRTGYESQGNWTLGQVCGHLANWIDYPMDGFPKPPLPLRPVFWIMKMTVAPGMKRKILAEGFKGGAPTAPQSVPEKTTSDQAGIDQLRRSVQRLGEWNRDLIPSPLFGPMDKDMLTRVSLLHAAHHLGYLEPDPK